MGKEFCFYCVFKANFLGHSKIWRST